MSSSQPVPVSGEDQPDPRVEAVAQALFDIYGSFNPAATGPALGHRARAGKIIAAIDAADRAAGIRRVTEQFTRQQQWGAWDDGYEAARTGQQKRNPHRPPVAAPVVVQEDRP